MNRSARLLLVSLSLLVSVPALAAPRLLESAGPEAPRARLLDVAPGQEAVEAEGESHVGRGFAQFGLGLVGGAVGGVAGLYALGGLCRSGFEGCVVAYLVGPLVGASLGAALGVYGVGALLEGRGGFIGTLVGALVGAGLGAGLAYGISSLAGLVLIPPLAVLGGMIGYGQSEQAAGLGLHRLRPVLGASPRGALVGLGGAF